MLPALGAPVALAALIERATANLDWGELVGRVARHSPSRAATRALLALVPSIDREEAAARYQRTEETLALYANGSSLPTRDCPDLDETLARLQRGSILEARELHGLGQILLYASELRDSARSFAERAPSVARAMTSDRSLVALEQELMRSIDESGAISDDATPALRSARARAQKAKADLLRELSRALKRHAALLRDAYYTEWEGRYVLPVRSDSYQRALGIVLGSSASGGTLYVEPPEITELGNQWKLAQTEVAREEERVLMQLSRQAELLIEPVKGAEAACVLAGTLIAFARWASATASIPVPISHENGLTLKAMRHPLMLGENIDVVPNDLVLQRGSALIISGPNAGGKTVALKCLGLAVWMARAGLPIPAGPGSSMGWFEPVLTDFGDQQSLSQSLSTFSAHIRTLTAILTHGQREALVLLDEVAAGTDPQEGSALAAAILEDLVRQDAAVAVTTHYELLKELAARQSHFVNASMLFDFQAMQPTFKLIVGVPGRSSALLVAARYGIPEAVIERAQELLPTQALEREKAVEQLNAERAALAEIREAAERDQKRHTELVAEAEAERRAARAQERERLVQEAHALTHAVREARATLEHQKQQLGRQKPDKTALREAERVISKAARQVSIGSELSVLAQAPTQAATDPAPRVALLPGVSVYLPALGLYGVVVATPKRDRISVRAGAVHLDLAVDGVVLDTRPGKSGTKGTLEPVPGGRARKRVPNALGTTDETSALPNAPRTSDVTLDLRGVRVEAGLEQVDLFIDDLLIRGQPQGFVLHGHGTGAMKSAVRSHLQTSTYVAVSRPATKQDGGDALTVFWLRE